MLSKITCENISYIHTLSNSLYHISLDITSADFFIITGANGTGKTTFLKILSGTLQPTAGVVNCNGKIHLMQDTLIEHLTILENVLLPIKIRNINFKKYIPYALELLSLLGVNGYNRITKTVSSGEKYLITFAQSVLLHPDILIIDDLHNTLDPVTYLKFLDVLLQLHSEGVGIICAVHTLEDILPYMPQIPYTEYALTPNNFLDDSMRNANV